MTISLELASTIIAAARQSAVGAAGPAMNIAVVDTAAHLVSFARMDGALLGCIDIALKKARTAALFGTDTGLLGTALPDTGSFGTLLASNGGLVTIGGGVLLHDRHGAVIGALGVSGGTADQDEAVARAAAATALP